ncbi:MAG: carboxylating nicotinate-nucleotide diphosphorylase [Thermodesulfobacteriota bacterium]|nr:MAG: carboxylating nicotinate-nucleotide diphosphorylase [Candidatus Dadabacteria bacterium]|tara:strand:- start:5979 stop:6821 length:843 start_codon:yes stop_codon:yes gene_type:complete
MNNALKNSINVILKAALNEDKIHSDITTLSLVDSRVISCEIKFKEKAVLCGTKIVTHIAKNFNKKIKIEWKYNDGDLIKRGTRVGLITGPANKILSIERILLNFLQKTSGIATSTSILYKSIKNTKIKLLDTRKTTPGWRLIEKYSVKVGGGNNHRLDLSKLILIKDNHIKFCNGINKALKKLQKAKSKNEVEVEVKSIHQLNEALKFKIKRIMLDNFNLSDTKKAIKIIRKYPKVEIEVSGGINVAKIKEISNLDIDFISAGSITHSSQSIDISMNVLK